MPDPDFPAVPALGGLCAIAQSDTGQARRVADFLLAWHNAQENGAWDPTDLWQVDWSIADDLLQALGLVVASRAYPGDLDFAPEIERIWRRWRGTKSSAAEEQPDAPAPGMV